MKSEPISFGRRLQQLLDGMDPPRSQAWVAERAGVERSTVSRIVNGERRPAPETLALFAVVFDTTVPALVAGTDVEARTPAASDLVPRADLQAAISQVLEFEQRLSDAERRCEQTRQALAGAELRSQQHVDELAKVKGRCATLTRERDEGRREASRLRADLGRYRGALEKAVAEVSTLRGQLRDLGEEVRSGKQTARTAAILAGLAAVTGVVTVGMFLRHVGQDDDDAEPEE